MENKAKVAKSIRQYMRYPSRYRDGLRETLSLVTSRLQEPVIFGGMIREFALGNTRQFRSDIDIVTRSNSNEVLKAIAAFSPQRNKFGGFRFCVGTQLYDIWAFDDTWAFKKGLIEGSALQDIFKTTFFNLDAVAYNLQERKILCSENYVNELQNRILDMNLPENPSPHAMARRAIRMALINSLQITPKLGEYILRNADFLSLDGLSRSYIRSLKLFIATEPECNFSFVPQATLFPSRSSSSVSAELTDIF